jgi:cyclopropane-fatty-acyl-phospholipid synthase
LRSVGRSTSLTLSHLEDIGPHYALTLNEWRRRFLDARTEVLRLGFDERFVRMWDYYLAYCVGAFRERYIGDAQLLLTKMHNPTAVLGDPRPAQGTADLYSARELGF